MVNTMSRTARLFPWQFKMSAKRQQLLFKRATASLLLVAGVGFLIVGALGARKEFSSLRAAEISLAERDFAAAEKFALKALELQPDSSRALLIAGRSASMQSDSERSLDYLRQIPAEATLVGVDGRIDRGERCLRLGLAIEAEASFREALRHDPRNRRSIRLLMQLLANEGRTAEAMKLASLSLRLGRAKLDDALTVVGIDRLLLCESQFVDTCAVAQPNELLPRLGILKRSFYENWSEDGARQVEQIARKHPHIDEANSVLGRMLFEAGTEDEFQAWHSRLPESVNEHPEIWSLRGRWARAHGQLKPAVRCYWETLRRHPDHGEANFQLSQLCLALGDKENAALFAERSQLVSTLGIKMADAVSGVSPIVARPIVAIMEKLGRYGEAAAWCQMVLEGWPSETWARDEEFRLSMLVSRLGFIAVPRIGDFSQFPLPDFRPAGSAPSTPELSAAKINFLDSAPTAGINFQYFNGADPQSGRAYMFEFSGGGIGVVDFDGDCWPDLYLTQGCRWPQSDGNHEHRDQIYRNIGNGQFTNVTEVSGIEEFRYSQGIAAGDFDNDGFPDLYVASIGPNKLFHNQGDGTFREVVSAAGADGREWTTSCLMADLNGDGLPDIYAVNYLSSKEVFDRRCEAQDRPIQCGPTLFDAEQDRLYLNLGDGRFEDVTPTSGIIAPDGKGLGIIAADLDGSGRLSLFIANDTTPNFLFVNETNVAGGLPRFSEQGILAGAAVDEQGQAQSCMGVAADDVDGDGLFDLFVTNFYRESNVLYFQKPGQTFVDGTRRAGLREPSFLEMGWGTQFLDADLDGWPDLFIANGHINEIKDRGMPYRMLPQFFRNQGQGRFTQLAATDLGAYFNQRYLGRSAARLDWNRDGLEDLAVGHVDAPFSLLTNHTEGAGHYLRLKLIGVSSSRDAVGTIAHVTFNDGTTVTKQLFGGDGFECSNERQMHFGLGQRTVVDRLSLRWPSGLVQEFESLPADQSLIVVEGQQMLSSSANQ